MSTRHATPAPPALMAASVVRTLPPCLLTPCPRRLLPEVERFAASCCQFLERVAQLPTPVLLLVASDRLLGRRQLRSHPLDLRRGHWPVRQRGGRGIVSCPGHACPPGGAEVDFGRSKHRSFPQPHIRALPQRRRRRIQFRGRGLSPRIGSQ